MKHEKNLRYNLSEFWKQTEEQISKKWVEQHLLNTSVNFNEIFFYLTELTTLKNFLNITQNIDQENALKTVLKTYQDLKLDINYKGPNGQTIAHYFMSEWNLKVAELLIKEQADLELQDSNGLTPLALLDEYFIALLSINPQTSKKELMEAKEFINAHKEVFGWKEFPDFFKDDDITFDQLKTISEEVDKDDSCKMS